MAPPKTRSPFAVAVGEGDELLAPVGADADHHQQAQLVLVQADADVVRSDRGALPVFLPLGF
jgi:hypothetical protein